MTKIAYDPIKDRFARIIRDSKRLRRLFYFILDLFFLRSWHLRRLLKEIGEGLEKKGQWKILDAGCGFGQYDYFFLKKFKNVSIHSVDLKEEYLEDNKFYFEKEVDEGRISFFRKDLLTFTTNEQFNLVLCVDVLEHIEDDVKVINNLSAALKTDGYLLMHSPSHYSEIDANEEDTFVGEHARTGYSKSEIEKKMMEADLLPLKTHYTYGKFGRQAWILSIKYPMILFNKLGLIALIPLMAYYPIVMPFVLLMNYMDLYSKNRKGTGIYAFAKKI